MKRQLIDVPDLDDDARTLLPERFGDLIGVDAVDVHLDDRQVVVTYDEGWIGEAGVMGVIQDAGYDVPDAPAMP